MIRSAIEAGFSRVFIHRRPPPPTHQLTAQMSPPQDPFQRPSCQCEYPLLCPLVLQPTPPSSTPTTGSQEREIPPQNRSFQSSICVVFSSYSRDKLLYSKYTSFFLCDLLWNMLFLFDVAIVVGLVVVVRTSERIHQRTVVLCNLSWFFCRYLGYPVLIWKRF